MVHVNIHAEETEILMAKAYREKRSGTEYVVLELFTPADVINKSVIAFYASNPNELADLVNEAKKALIGLGVSKLQFK